MTEYELSIVTDFGLLKCTVVEADTTLKAVKQAYGDMRWFNIGNPHENPHVLVHFFATTKSGHTLEYFKSYTCQAFRDLSEVPWFNEDDVDHALQGDRMMFYSVDRSTGEFTGDMWLEHYDAEMEIGPGDRLEFDWLPGDFQEVAHGYSRKKRKTRRDDEIS
jgi:hypothetical protein